MNKNTGSLLKRMIVISAVAAFVIMLIFFVVFKFMTSPERIKTMIISTGSQTLNKVISIDQVHFRPGTLILKNTLIKPEDNESDSYIKINLVKVNFKMFPLLKGRFVPNELKIIKPEIYINEALKLEQDRFSRDKITAFLLSGSILPSLDRISVSKGMLEIKIKGNAGVSLKNITANIRNSSKQVYMCDLSAESSMKYLKTLESKFRMDLHKKEIDLEKLILNISGGIFKLTGSVIDLIDKPGLKILFEMSEYPAELFNDAFKLEGAPSLSGKLENSIKTPSLTFKADLGDCELYYKNLKKKGRDDKLIIQGGLAKKAASIELDWLVIDGFLGLFSGTGQYTYPSDVHLNIVGENVPAKQLGNMFLKGGRIFHDGMMNMKLSLSYISGRLKGTSSLNIKALEISGLKGLDDIYSRLTRDKKTKFLFNKMDCKFEFDNESVRIAEFKSKGGDIEGYAKGSYSWDGRLNFILYPRIYGRELGFRIYGTRTDVKYSLK